MKDYWSRLTAGIANLCGISPGHPLPVRACRGSLMHRLSRPMTVPWFYLTRPGAHDVQLSLFTDHGVNVAIYPKFQEYFRLRQPHSSPVFDPGERVTIEGDNQKQAAFFRLSLGQGGSCARTRSAHGEVGAEIWAEIGLAKAA